MAALNVIVEKLMARWRKTVAEQKFPLAFLLISLVGSGLKELEVVPHSYFSSSKNALNVYFVKVSWGWTLLLLTPFVLISNFSLNRSRTSLGQRLLSLVVATAIWYICTETFSYIEDWTGSCFETDARDVINKEFTSKISCRRAGFHWRGYDISGHSFILAYSALLIKEETAPMDYLQTAKLSALPRMVLYLLYRALNLILIIWVWMFICTSVYFHDPAHKFIGTMCGLVGWYLTYEVWYKKPFSPGLPPQHRPKEQKQHA